MLRVEYECVLCGYTGGYRHLRIIELLDGKPWVLSHPSNDTDIARWLELPDADRWGYICRDECHGLRLSWWERRKINRSLKQWTK